MVSVRQKLATEKSQGERDIIILLCFWHSHDKW